jgi:hypothetical protein
MFSYNRRNYGGAACGGNCYLASRFVRVAGTSEEAGTPGSDARKLRSSWT